MWCAIIQEVWCNFRDLNIRSLLLPRYYSWEKNLLGELHQCHTELVDEKMKWDIIKLCITMGYLIFRSSLLWFIWCQKMQTQF
jgi:hypothetical protein